MFTTDVLLFVVAVVIVIAVVVVIHTSLTEETTRYHMLQLVLENFSWGYQTRLHTGT